MVLMDEQHTVAVGERRWSKKHYFVSASFPVMVASCRNGSGTSVAVPAAGDDRRRLSQSRMADASVASWPSGDYGGAARGSDPYFGGGLGAGAVIGDLDLVLLQRQVRINKGRLRKFNQQREKRPHAHTPHTFSLCWIINKGKPPAKGKESPCNACNLVCAVALLILFPIRYEERGANSK